MPDVDVPATFGALILGALSASFLSGSVGLQSIVYFKVFSNDNSKMKLLVSSVWILDVIHTTFIWAAIWRYFVRGFGDADAINNIYWSIPMSVTVTAILTFLVHCFFAYRIHILSDRRWILTVPIVIVSFLRLLSATGTTAAMFMYDTFTSFKTNIQWIFTLGLALTTLVDVIITTSLTILLKTNGKRAPTMIPVFNKLTMYAFETGLLTLVGAIVSMICWIKMSHNLIFLGLHFFIAKLYASSLLVTLNTRQELLKRRQSATISALRTGPTIPHDPSRSMMLVSFSNEAFSIPNSRNRSGIQVHVGSEKSVSYDVSPFEITPISNIIDATMSTVSKDAKHSKSQRSTRTY